MTDRNEKNARPARSRPGGRSADVVAAVHSAAVQLLEEVGYERLELPEVAARAGVNKTTVYRRWPGKAELVLEIALLKLRREVPLPDTGTLVGDLGELLFDIQRALQQPLMVHLLSVVVGQSAQAEGLHAVRTQFWDERFAVSGQLVQRGVERGELPADTDPRQFLELAASPLFFRSVITGATVSPDEVLELARRTVFAFSVG